MEKIKLLTYGSASMHKNRKRNFIFWKIDCFEYSEKQDCLFFEIKGEVFCTFIEDGIPKIEQVGLEDKVKNKKFDVVKIDIEEMKLTIEPINYDNTSEGLSMAKDDFINKKLKSKFLSMSRILCTKKTIKK